MSSPHQLSLAALQQQAKTHRRVLVGFSGGKDSLCVLDLCCRAFREVVCAFFYFVPGLNVIEDQFDLARERYGVQVAQYPSRMLVEALQEEVYRPVSHELDGLEKMGANEQYLLAMSELDCTICATGQKKKDYAGRGTIMRAQEKIGVIHPIDNWTKFDVLAYLRLRDIPLPPSSGRATTGVELSTPSLLWLHDNYPQDFEKLCEAFPYARAAIGRREYFGVQ